jgi:hypothetical protein
LRDHQLEKGQQHFLMIQNSLKNNRISFLGMKSQSMIQLRDNMRCLCSNIFKVKTTELTLLKQKINHLAKTKATLCFQGREMKKNLVGQKKPINSLKDYILSRIQDMRNSPHLQNTNKAALTLKERVSMKAKVLLWRAKMVNSKCLVKIQTQNYLYQ